jgi:hypothetical protein
MKGGRVQVVSQALISACVSSFWFNIVACKAVHWPSQLEVVQGLSVGVTSVKIWNHQREKRL